MSTQPSTFAIDERIIRFIRRHHVLTLATTDECDTPYCSNAFYCYDATRNLLIFSSGLETQHAQHMAQHPRVGVSIVLETRVVGKLQGLQLRGTAAAADSEARSAYLRRFPFAAVIDLTLWSIAPDFMKFTDNTLGFGKKLTWNG